MRRLPASREMAKLAQVSKARELVALAKLAEVAAERAAADAAVVELMSQTYEANSVKEAEVIAKWKIWRSEELRRRSTRLAAATAEYQVAAKHCGRFVAENEVVERIARLAKEREIAERARRAADITSPVERYP